MTVGIGGSGGDLGAEDRSESPRGDNPEGGNDREGALGRLRRNRRDREQAVVTRSPEPNIGNVSGLGGRQNTFGTSLMARRRARGASVINLMPGLADATRGSLFGL